MVMFHRMIENGAQLIVERFQVHGGVGLAVLVPVVEHFILPCHDFFGVNIAHLPLAESMAPAFVKDMLFVPQVFSLIRPFMSAT